MNNRITWRSSLKGMGLLWYPSASSAGFTLVEKLIVLVVLGILMAIAAPAWNGFLASRSLRIGQDQLYHALRDAQSRATQRSLRKEFLIRESNNLVQWAIVTVGSAPNTRNWQPLPPDLRLDHAETTLLLSGDGYQVQFDHRGNVAGQLGRITLRHQNNNRLRRCVIVATLLGAVRTGTERPTPDETGRFCY